MNISRKIEVEQLRNAKSELFDKDVLHILNGQMMYEEFKNEKLMGESDYAPFNDVCKSRYYTSFDEEFIKTRAMGHSSSVEDYIKKVINPLNNLFKRNMNVLFYGLVTICFAK